MMFGNPVREAGLGGFEWRDQTILEKINQSKKDSFKPKLFRYSLLLLAAALMLFGAWGISPIAFGTFLAFAIVVKYFRLDSSFPQSSVLYALGNLMVGLLFSNALPSEANMDVSVIITSLASLLLLIAIIEGEALALSTSMVSGTSLIGSHPFLVSYELVPIIVIILTTVLWISYARKTNHFAHWLDNLTKGANRFWEEPIRLPVGYHQVGTKILKASLKDNSGKISTRHRGSIAERKTAMELIKLPPGSVVYHDIALPGADLANIDHIAVTKHGVFVIDTKLFLGKVYEENGSILKKNSPKSKTQDLSGITRQMLWAKTAIEDSLDGIQVKSIVAIQKAEVDGMPVAKDKKRGNVAYIPLSICVETIESFPVIYDETQIKKIMSDLIPVVGSRKPVYSKKNKRFSML